MQQTFNPADFIKTLGLELITEFERAGLATQSCAVGTGRETSVKTKLKGILPAGVGIGSGFVIDSYGNTSKQCDIILYEEMYAAKFIINNDESNAYYNCENVIAVGEIKSTMKQEDFIDACNKLKIIKKLIRFSNPARESYRPYFNPIELPAKGGFDQINNKYHQIYTFIICKELKIKFEKIIELSRTLFEEKSYYYNTVMSLNDGLLLYLNKFKNRTEPSAIDATNFYIQNNDENFNKFLADLIHFIEFGGSTYCPKAKYFQSDKGKSLPQTTYPI